MELKVEIDENYWITELQAGNQDALVFFFELHYKPLLYFAGQIVQNSYEAEDIVSDCFFKLWQRHKGFETPQKIKAFLFISCRNACLNYIQHQKVKTGAHEVYLKDSQGSEENILSMMIKTEVLDFINREVEQLPQKMQEIFKMIYFEGKNTNEIALELQLSVQTVRNQKTKAIDMLKIAMFKKGLSASVYAAFLLFLKLR
jgi:RNA polymerase sigma-70 factor (family 1)